MVILNAIAAFGNWFWGIPILFLIVGGVSTLRSVSDSYSSENSDTYAHRLSARCSLRQEKAKFHRLSAACAALASSIGASHIVGVPAAVVMGGPGAVFWIWLIALIGCATKYTEIALLSIQRKER